MSALRNFANSTPTQREQARPDQVVNSAGGYVFSVDDQTRLERFLILGTDGGTYYVGEKDLTKQNVSFIRKMIATNPAQVLNTAVQVSSEGRAYRNEAAIFVLALLIAEAPADFKVTATNEVAKIARIGTHAYQLAEFLKNLGGWNRAKSRAIANWFKSKTADQLAYQAVKYRQRDGWTMRDLMRLSHVKGVDPRVGSFILGKAAPYQSGVIEGFQAMQKETSLSGVLNILDTFPNLPWEAIPTQFLKDAEVWKKLFANGQLQGQALVRQITRLSRLGAFNDMVFAAEVAKALTDKDMIVRTRLHPIQYLLASITHREGQLERSGYSSWYGDARIRNWDVSHVIADALDEGFYQSFKAVNPANKRTLIGLDVSGSMGQNALGIDLSCAQVGAAMAMLTARTEPFSMVRGFTTTFEDLGITPKQDFATILKKVDNHNFGETDCAQPMLWAARNGVEVDHFIIVTDNETWIGSTHAHTALKQYRQKTGIPAKTSVVGVAATDFSIADPTDPGMLDVCGFDTNTPAVLADFAAGRL